LSIRSNAARPLALVPLMASSTYHRSTWYPCSFAQRSTNARWSGIDRSCMSVERRA